MFHSATLKLTAWYLAILMAISLLFSFVIYQLHFHEISIRLENLQNGLIETHLIPEEGPTFNSLLQIQSDQAALQMIQSLFYINLIVLVGGGIGSYWLARRTLQPIEQVHTAQSRFTSNASHELRTPLAAMKTELEATLRGGPLDETETRELLESNLEEVNKLIALSEMLLNLARLDDQKLERQRIDLADIVKETMKRFKDSQKRFTLDIGSRLYVYGNEPALLELLTILLDNAIKHSPADSKIAIKAYRKSYLVNFEIQNEGDIPDSLLPTLFDRFVRGDVSRTKSGEKGFGLGLAIAKEIVLRHQGEIEVASKDGMTRFSFYLPLKQVPSRTKRKITTK